MFYVNIKNTLLFKKYQGHHEFRANKISVFRNVLYLLTAVPIFIPQFLIFAIIFELLNTLVIKTNYKLVLLYK